MPTSASARPGLPRFHSAMVSGFVAGVIIGSPGTDLGWLRPGSYQNRVDFAGLPSGSYLIEIKSNELVSTKSVTLIK